ncbi:MAG: PcfK-like family protein [Oscillospiraceae bacterium]|jgi:pseudouridine-5'-phosphate glycosidase|nr:PcfK-like family protein [Oscillospiraceae bacterium]
MSELIQQAIAKIDKEAESIGQNGKYIAEYLIQEVIKTDAAAGQVLTAGKSLKECLAKVTSNAKKQAQNNMAMVDNETVFAWVREYFGVDSLAEKPKSKTINLADFL